jgi:hypothetical protein
VINRIVRVIRLDPTVFREVAEDRKSMTQAAIIVLVVSMMSAIGGFIKALMAGQGFGSSALGFFVQLIVSSILIGWIGWAVITYFVGTMLFKGKTDIPEMMRVLGFASAPNLLGIFSFIPCVGWLISLAGSILSLVAGFIAIREAMDFDSTKAILTVVIGWVIALVLSLVVGGIFGLGWAGIPFLGG